MSEPLVIALAGFLISYAAVAVGWVTFGVATMRTKLFPRWAAALLEPEQREREGEHERPGRHRHDRDRSTRCWGLHRRTRCPSKLPLVRATVVETREVAKGTLLALFAVDDYPDYRPGSYFWVELPDRGHQDEKGLRRHISLVTSPTEPGSVGLATRLRDTAFKRTLAKLEVGDEVEVEEPKGSFLLPEDVSVSYVFIAGGIGITVFRSMLRYIADEQLPYRVILVYSNRDRESAAFLDELEELERRIDGLHLILTMTEDPSWKGETRRIDEAMLRDTLGNLESQTFFVAGPPEMAKAVEATLHNADVPEERVFTDSFSGY